MVPEGKRNGLVVFDYTGYGDVVLDKGGKRMATTKEKTEHLFLAPLFEE